MSISAFIIELFPTLLECFVLTFILAALFKPETHKNYRAEIILSLLAAALVLLSNQFQLVSYVNIFGLQLLYALFFMRLYRQPFRYLLTAGSLYYLYMFLTEFSILSIMSMLFEDQDYLLYLLSEPGVHRIIPIILTKIPLLLLLWAVLKWIKPRLKQISVRRLIPVIVIGYAWAIFLVDQILRYFDVYNMLSWWMLVIIIVLAFLLYYLYTKNQNREKTSRTIEMRNELLLNNYRSLQEAYQENAKLYHDMKNHHQALYSLLENSEYEEARQYLLTLSEPLNQHHMTRYTQNMVIDSILNTKKAAARKNIVNITYDIEYPETAHIQPADLCTILANLLDNALEACWTIHEPDKRWIKLTLRPIHQMLIIKVENSVSSTAKTVSHQIRLRTAKADKRKHGWGLISVESAAKKYDGTLGCTSADSIFTAVVTLSLLSD